METNVVGGDVFFLLMGAILMFAMHAGFAFLEVGTVREKNQVNAMVKIISDFAMPISLLVIRSPMASIFWPVHRSLAAGRKPKLSDRRV